MDNATLVAMVVSPLATLAVVGLGQILNHRSGKARAEEVKVDLSAQINSIKTDMNTNMSQLRNDLSTQLLRVEEKPEKVANDLKEWFRSELRASIAELQLSLAQTPAKTRAKAVGQGSSLESS